MWGMRLCYVTDNCLKIIFINYKNNQFIKKRTVNNMILNLHSITTLKAKCLNK